MIKVSNNKKNTAEYAMNNDIKMSIFEHLEELRHRAIKATIFFIIITGICFSHINDISFVLQKPALGIKFLQLAPGEYFFSSIKISVYMGLIFSSPFIIYQLVLFILPGLTLKETQFLLPILLSSIILFFIGIFFSYSILIPAALHFFINYGADVVEPIWSFEQYFDFILILLISTGLAFQIPIVQIIIGLLNIISSQKMLQSWKYILLLSTIISAILTPSTDPVTQLFLSLAILILYFTGAFILKFLNK
uniref:Sec-independent protein translocase-like protein n=1 Tax=Calliarthron tuberculosum TaxID=48942 RepID=M4IV74_CALTB|nr:sec-independent protein translocase-like protein [Calliarthron tuberculosum]AGA63867.1 sec-independent protein translocase-like protein [Calliarthron tuberculosum]